MVFLGSSDDPTWRHEKTKRFNSTSFDIVRKEQGSIRALARLIGMFVARELAVSQPRTYLVDS